MRKVFSPWECVVECSGVISSALKVSAVGALVSFSSTLGWKSFQEAAIDNVRDTFHNK